MKKKTLLCESIKNYALKKIYRYFPYLDNAALESQKLLSKIVSVRNAIPPNEVLVREAPETP